ncbi:MAG: hypothetical protein AAF670_20905, partial [Planctomycetota bacterium]
MTQRRSAKPTRTTRRGARHQARSKRAGAARTSRTLQHQTLDKRELLAAEIISGPRLVSVEAGSGSQIRLDETSLVNRLESAPRELTFRFDGTTQLDASTLSGIRIQASGGDGTFDDGNETFVETGFLGFADDEVGDRVVVSRFVNALPDDRYRIQIAGYDSVSSIPENNVTALRDVDGNAILPADQINSPTPSLNIDFEVEVGANIVAVVPQPVSGTAGNRARADNEIHVYFNNDPLSNPAAGPIDSTSSTLTVVDPDFYRLIVTNDTVETNDDVQYVPAQTDVNGNIIVPAQNPDLRPTRVRYEPSANRVVLTYSQDLSAMPGLVDGAGTFRLRVGSEDVLPDAPTVFNVGPESVGGDNTFD